VESKSRAGFQSGNGQVKHECQPTNHSVEDSGKYLRSPVFSAWMRYLPATGWKVQKLVCRPSCKSLWIAPEFSH